MSITISSLQAREILDSRGNPTIEVDATLSDGSFGRAAVPSGASTGSKEAIELRDGGDRYGGKGVMAAAEHVSSSIADRLRTVDPLDQRAIDQALIELDGTDNKERLGANAILGVSLAIAKAAAAAKSQPLYRYVAELAGTTDQMTLPMPMMNVMNGGQHAAGATDIQEYMIIPKCAATFDEALQIGTAVFHQLGALLKQHGFPTTVGDEGGFAPRLPGGNRAPFQLLVEAIRAAGYEPGRDVSLAIDAAASEFYTDSTYQLTSDDQNLSSDELIDWYGSLLQEFPIVSIEDGLDENDWGSWTKLAARFGDSTQLVGDDLLVTNVALLQRAITDHAANAILIKPNQIGTLSETIDAVLTAKQAGWRTIISHRSGETEDTTIAHLAVGLGAGQIKTGSLSRTERLAKYNELLRIAEAEPQLTLNRLFR